MPVVRRFLIHRKLSHGTRTDRGERFIERALSASITCRLQHRSLYTYLSDLLTAHARGDPLPRSPEPGGVNGYGFCCQHRSRRPPPWKGGRRRWRESLAAQEMA